MTDKLPISDPATNRPRLVAFVEAFGVTCFAIVTIIGFLNIVWPDGDNANAILACVFGLATFVSVYVLCLGLRGNLPDRRRMLPAAILPSALVIFEAGAILTVLFNGPNSPLGGAVEGISGPLSNGMLSILPWPVSFLLGSMAGIGLIIWMARLIRNDPAD